MEQIKRLREQLKKQETTASELAGSLAENKRQAEAEKDAVKALGLPADVEKATLDYIDLILKDDFTGTNPLTAYIDSQNKIVEDACDEVRQILKG